MKKAGFILFLVLILVITGCQQSSKTNGSSKKQKELRIINYRVEDKAYYDELNKKFQEKYPDIKIKYDSVPTKDYQVLFNSRTAAGEVDLVAGAKDYIRTEKSRDMFMDLTGKPVLSKYKKEALKLEEVKGKNYLVPWNNVAMVTFYNKKILKELNIEMPKTWDEFKSAAQKAKKKGYMPVVFGGKDQWPIAMPVNELEATMVRSKDSKFNDKLRDGETKFTDPVWVDMLSRLKELGSLFQQNSAGLAYGQAPGIFAQGKAAFMVDGSWSASQITAANPKLDYGVMNLPGSNNADDNKNLGVKSGGGWMVTKDSPNKDAAMKYLDFISEKENYEKYINFTKSIPVMDGVKVGKEISMVEELVNANNVIPVWESTFIPGAKYDFVNLGMKLISNNITPEKAAEQMQKDLEGSKKYWKE
ncbi:ABC transporter substrate-binding protein [Fictibacillus fluitans]|uniref:Extracellular solute-binding protein n=1 Tax=Fictibacillus fluitans TaxID=3058422 RepID=A0ABT8HWN8_9BACL|nr:extracellular solute-binding protein [Fictibacillus sp. NE201]MDN4525180.1 extracellular solute-binding protein [Fictibacillus sp. NE201]